MASEFSAGAVLFRKDEKVMYLLLHYEEGHWDFPKGNVENGEEEKETVMREVKEETGISDVGFIKGFKEKITYFYIRNSKKIFKEAVFYLAETKEKNIKLSYEHIGYKWLGYDDALKQITYKNSKGILRKAYQFVERQKGC